MNIRSLPLRSFGLLFCVAVLGLSRAQAQSAEAAAIGLHINGLTSAERDALAQDLDTQGELHVSFACVPAGILVLEGTGRTVSTPERRQAALHAVRQRIAAARISEEQLTLSTAEALCAEARNH